MKNRSALMYIRRKKMDARRPCCSTRKYISETSNVRYAMNNTLSHQRLEESMVTWLEYTF